MHKVSCLLRMLALNMNAEDMSQLASLEVAKANTDYLEVLNKCSSVPLYHAGLDVQH